MERFYNLALLFLLVVVTTNCSTPSKINSFKPEPDDAIPLVYENTPSFINLPITIQLKDIENTTNNLLNGLIYEDNIIEDDNIEIKIWKLAPITIENSSKDTDRKIKTILPLKANVKYRIGTKKMGLDLYTIKEFNFNGIITLNSEVELVNWKLNTKTKLESLNWNESPTMVLFGKNVPITFLINSSTTLFKSKIEQKIDESIAKSMDFKSNVVHALEKISIPFQMSEQYESWLRITPTEIYSTNAILKNQTILLDMGIRCIMETLIGKKPETKFNANTIVLKPVAKIPNQITANITAVLNYDEASKILTKNFSGQEFSSGKKKIKVHNVSIWHKNSKMVIGLDVLGSLNGTVYLTGVPKYNETTKEIYFDQMDYALDTKNKLLQTANWLAQGYILNKIQANCHYSIQTNLDEGKKSIMAYLKNYSPMAGVFVNGKIEDIQFKRIQLTNQAFIAFLKISGEVNITVDGLK
ncbi:DUF4403 family protein [Flavobacterium sp.]|uniref:DUF4403 family protein n=1 Tax=Flavobacterium sp. TaxID=239 RepID=UPI0035B1070D